MSAEHTAEVRMFGRLHTLRRERGLPTTVSLDVPSDGITAKEIALSLDLPVEHIEGVFCNHTMFGLGHRIMPGDRMAFVPHGTPGPHRVFLRIRREDDEDAE